MVTPKLRLAADSYYFNNSKYFERVDFVRRDAEEIIEFFDMLQDEVYEASKSYFGRKSTKTD